MRVGCLLTFASLLFSWLGNATAYQGPPTLRRVGPSSEHVSGSLNGFRVTQAVLPGLSPRQSAIAEGTAVSLTLTVAGGRPIHAQVDNSAAPLAHAIRRAVLKWRFEMPQDGTSPVMVDLVVHCEHGKLWHDITMRLPQAP